MNKMIFNITQFLIFTENLHTYPNGHIVEIRKLPRIEELEFKFNADIIAEDMCGIKNIDNNNFIKANYFNKNNQFTAIYHIYIEDNNKNKILNKILIINGIPIN